MSIEAVIFDYGNTLVLEDIDSVEVMKRGIGNLARSLWSYGIDVDSRALEEVFSEIRRTHFARAEQEEREFPAVQSLKTALSKLGINEVSHELLAKGIDAFFLPEEEESHLLPYAAEILRELSHKGYPLGLISNATCGFLIRRVLCRHRIIHWFQTIIVSADVGYRKPRPEIFQLALQNLNVNPQRAVMVGDRLAADILGAKRVGMKAILLKTAHTQVDEEYEGQIIPDAEARSLPGVIEILKSC